jgi:hypothetical protein
MFTSMVHQYKFPLEDLVRVNRNTMLTFVNGSAFFPQLIESE